jgi:hypothetical protein
MIKRFAEIDPNTSRVLRVLIGNTKTWYETRLGGVWIELSEDQVASKDDLYHPELENFSGPQPYPSWTLDDQCNWQPPIAHPTDDKFYTWNEETRTWDEIPE